MREMSYMAAIGALALSVEGLEAVGDVDGHKSVGGGRIVGRDNVKGATRKSMPFRDRNALCECGSGKKRKKCCKGKHENERGVEEETGESPKTDKEIDCGIDRQE